MVSLPISSITDGSSTGLAMGGGECGALGLGGGGGSGKVEMKDFEFRMVSNKASPKLF